MSRHSATADHRPSDEARIRTAIAWGQHNAAKVEHDALMRARRNALLSGAHAWPTEVAS